MEKNEIVASLTHLIFGLVAIFLGVIVVLKGFLLKSPTHIISYFIFSVAMVSLYFASGIYHMIPQHLNLKKSFKKIDHIMIFAMIAGTYTPFCLITLNGNLGWALFGLVWGFAVLGIIFKLFYINANRLLNTSIYIFMGWIVVVAIYPIYKNLTLNGFIFLLAGGLFYTVGGIVYAFKKPNPFPNIFGFHEIWHIFVILGTIFHYLTIYRYT